jgi:drug/metabolite transporter (DMT)-like permease
VKKFYLIGFLVLMGCDTLAQCSIKLASLHAGELQFHLAWAASILHQAWLYFAVAGYIGSFFTWMTLLKHAPVGPAFAASHLEKVSVLFVSVVWLGESLSFVQVVGCVLILGGIALLGVAETRVSHGPA